MMKCLCVKMGKSLANFINICMTTPETFMEPPAGQLRRLKPEAYVGLLLFVCALLLYGLRLNQPPRYIYDESYHAYTAGELVKGNRKAYLPGEAREGFRAANGQRVYTTWTHPPLSRDLMQIGIHVFGDNSIGWRVLSAFFGALGIVVVFCIGREFFSYQVGVFAAVLLLFDGLWFVQSRTAMLDIFLACFLLLAYFCFGKYLLRSDQYRWKFLWLAGAALGLALATKWSAIYSLFFLGVWAFVREVKFTRGEKSLRGLWVFLGVFALLPPLEYLMAHAQFFAMGYSLSDWLNLQSDMWHYHTTLQAHHNWASPWWSWPLLLKPVWYHVGVTPTEIQHVFALGNPAIWWMFFPALGYFVWRWKAQNFNMICGLVLLGFLGNWLPWALSPRIAFLYHFLPSVPFGCLMIAVGFQQLSSTRRQFICWSYFAIVLLSFQYFYPHFAAVLISREYSQQHFWLRGWKPVFNDPFERR